MSTAVAAHSPLNAASSSSSQRHTTSSPQTSHQQSTQQHPVTPSRRPPMSTIVAQRQASGGPGNSPFESAATPSSAQNKQTSPTSAASAISRSKVGRPPATPSSAHVPIIKKERQGSPEHHTPGASSKTVNTTERHRPRHLDLSNSNKADAGRPSAPLTAQRSAGLSAMQDVGLACLSPGFQTQDPQMQQQLQRSMDLREQQRQIIEARQRNKDANVMPETPDVKKKPRGNLTIHAPPAHEFMSQPKGVQSAPLHATFTGLRPGDRHHPLSREILHGPSPSEQRQQSGYSSSQHPPPPSTSYGRNRLPPISDVFGHEGLGSGPQRPSSTLGPQDSNSAFHGPLHSPGFPPNPPLSAGLHPSSSQHHHSSQPRTQATPRRENSSIPPINEARPRFSSAEEAVRHLSGGREDLQPKVVHYGGHQPPTPPSPLPPGSHAHSGGLAPPNGPHSGRRRPREEYERDFADGERMDVDPRTEKRAYAPWDERDHRAAPHPPPAPAAEGPPTATNPPPAYDRHPHSADAASWERGRPPPPPLAAPQDHGVWDRGGRPRDVNGGPPPSAPAVPQGPFGYGRDSPDTQRRKKDEFMALCARAWDLFHS